MYTNADLKICQYLRIHMKIICWRFHIKTPIAFWDMHTWDMWKVGLQTLRNNIAYVKIILLFNKFANLKAREKLTFITREFLRLRMRNFQGIVFIWTQTCSEIFQSALV